MPRRKPDQVIEQRRSLGSYERQLEQDRITVQGMQAIATAVSGIASGIGGLGIGGGLLLGAMFFKEDLKDLLDTVKDFLPDDPDFGSPEWWASWGEDPIDQTGETGSEPDNVMVDQLVSAEGNTLTGMSPYHAYSVGAAGRQAEYDHRVAEATSQFTEAQMANWLHYPTNQPPPNFLLLDQWSQQVNLRVTGARRRNTYLRWVQETDPSKMEGYILDPMLDWSAGATYQSWVGLWTKSDKTKQDNGKRLIELYMNWEAPEPFNPPMNWKPQEGGIGLH